MLNLEKMFRIPVPIIIIIGEGGSGGALAIAVADRVLMMEFSSILSSPRKLCLNFMVRSKDGDVAPRPSI